MTPAEILAAVDDYVLDESVDIDLRVQFCGELEGTAISHIEWLHKEMLRAALEARLERLNRPASAGGLEP